jgi:hypothetical protein
MSTYICAFTHHSLHDNSPIYSVIFLYIVQCNPSTCVQCCLMSVSVMVELQIFITAGNLWRNVCGRHGWAIGCNYMFIWLTFGLLSSTTLNNITSMTQWQYEFYTFIVIFRFFHMSYDLLISNLMLFPFVIEPYSMCVCVRTCFFFSFMKLQLQSLWNFGFLVMIFVKWMSIDSCRTPNISM